MSRPPMFMPAAKGSARTPLGPTKKTEWLPSDSYYDMYSHVLTEQEQQVVT